VKFLVTALALCILVPSCLVTYSFFQPDYSQKECEAIRANYENIKVGMNKEEVLSFIGSEPSSKVYPYSKVAFPEQETQWEIWMLCADLNSCIYVESLGREQCYEWQMIAFDFQTGKVVKIFSDDPERIGFA